MPLPLLIPIAIGAGALSVGAAVHSTLKRRKWQKIHNEALAKAQRTDSETRSSLKYFNQEAQELGKLRVRELETLKKAANFLKRARVKHRELRPEFAEMRPAELENWRKLHGQAIKSPGHWSCRDGGDRRGGSRRGRWSLHSSGDHGYRLDRSSPIRADRSGRAQRPDGMARRRSRSAQAGPESPGEPRP